MYDVVWALCNRNAIKHAQENNWGLCRNTKMEMAEILNIENKLKPALRTYLELCYIDVNGPNNCGSITDVDLLKMYPPFDPNDGFLAPGIIDRIKKLITKLSFSEFEVKELFMEISIMVFKAMKLPLNPENAWKIIEVKLSEGSSFFSLTTES